MIDRTQIIPLTQLHPVVPQDGVGRGDVKIKIRQCAIQQKVLPAIGLRGTMALDGDFFPLRAIDLLWLEGVRETLNNSLF